MLFEYLVTSRSRRELLKALCSERQGCTVRQLALRTRTAYSNAHSEVARLVGMGVVTGKRIGNAMVCRWNARDSNARRLEALFRDPDARADAGLTEEVLYWNLKRYGAPLVHAGRRGRKLSAEETLGRAVVLARHHPEVARAWPVVLSRTRSGLKFSELERVARRVGQKKALGFLLALAGTLLNDSALVDRAGRLRDARATKPEPFFLLKRGRRAERLAEENTPPLAREWLFTMNTPMEGFESSFRKFVEAP